MRFFTRLHKGVYKYEKFIHLTDVLLVILLFLARDASSTSTNNPLLDKFFGIEHELHWYAVLLAAFVSVLTFYIAAVQRVNESLYSQFIASLFPIKEEVLGELGVGVYSFIKRQDKIAEVPFKQIVHDEILFYLIIEQFLMRNRKNLVKVEMALCFKNEGLIPFFVNRYRFGNCIGSNVETYKYFKLLHNSDYDRKSYKDRDIESIISWLYQIPYTKIFFEEGLPPENIYQFHIFGSDEPYKYPESLIDASGDSQKPIDNYVANDLVFLKTNRLCLIAKSTRNLRGFEFEDAEISLFNLGAGKHPELPQICERYFDKLKECREAQWNASLYEYALLSADKIKSIPVVGDRIYATDNYDLQASVDSWIQAPSPRWIVWRACEAISKKFSDERKKVGKKKEEDTKKGLLAELVHKIALALESQRPLSTRVKIDDESFIFRIFIVDDMIPAEQKEMRIVELIGVFALQIAIKINVRFIYRTTYEEWYKSRRRSVAPSNLTSGSKIPDFQIVCREERERWRVVSGINATNFPPDGTPEIHGQIVQNEQTWFAFFEELWSEAAKPTDIPEVRDQLLKPDIESTVSTIFEKSLVSVEKTDEQNRIRQITELAREALREYKSKNFPDSAKPTS